MSQKRLVTRVEESKKRLIKYCALSEGIYVSEWLRRAIDARLDLIDKEQRR